LTHRQWPESGDKSHRALEVRAKGAPEFRFQVSASCPVEVFSFMVVFRCLLQPLRQNFRLSDILFMHTARPPRELFSLVLSKGSPKSPAAGIATRSFILVETRLKVENFSFQKSSGFWRLSGSGFEKGFTFAKPSSGLRF
jgi:hypothetical protein